MPDTKKSHSNKYEFARANYAPLIARGLNELKHDSIAEFKAVEENDAAEALSRLKQSSNQQDLFTVFDTFAKMIEPTLDRKGGKDCKYLDWACKSWIKDPVRIEDLYKIKERLIYFEKLSGKLNKDGQKNQINQFKDFKALEDVMRPYEQERAIRAAERQERRMSDEDKQKLKKESTIVYDGAEGKVVIPHTIWASQYWGNQTKWCISAAKKEENAFEGYNKKAPVFIYLPKPEVKDFELCGEDYSSFKFAAVGTKIYDERDNAGHVTLPPCLNKLAMAAQESLSGASQEYLANHGLSQKIMDMPIGKTSGKHLLDNDNTRSDLSQYPEEWQGYLKTIRRRSRNMQDIPDSLKKDQKFMLAAVKQNGYALQYASKDLQKDKEIVLAAVKQYGRTLEYASKDLQKDKEVVLAAVKKSGRGLCYASKELKKDKEIVLAAIKQNGRALRYASEDLQNNKEIVLSAVKQNGWALDHVSKELQKEILDLKDSSIYFQDMLSGREEKNLSRGFNKDKTNLAELILAKGYGLSPNLVPEDLLSNPQYVLKALKTAREHGNANNMLDGLRHVEALWGDFGALIDINGAIGKLKKPIRIDNSLNNTPRI